MASHGENNEPPRICQVQEAADSESRPRATPREDTKEKGGYECEFVEPPPKQLQSECSICLLVLREPHIVSCCGHSFCKTCIGRIQRDGKPCPLCNEPSFTTVANGGLKRSLSEFQVRCPHRELGCEWVGELGKLDQHLNDDPQPERQLEGCQFTLVECIHCKDHMRRHVIAGHQNEHCPKRPYTCEYCEEYESTFEGVANHWAECKCYLLPCPNNCHPSGSGIKRQNLEYHMKKECPLTVVECVFHYAGCGVKLPHKDMAVHMKEESVAHNSLLAAENQKLIKQLLERDEKMQQLIQQNTELSHRIDQQHQALIQANETLQRAHQELAEKTDQVNQELQELVSKVTVQGQQMTNDVTQKPQIVPIDIKVEMARFKALIASNSNTHTDWCSTPFYTHNCGYKMRLHISYHSYFSYSDQNYITVAICLARGEVNSDLKWPFRGVITIQLLNQLEDREHHTETINLTNEYSDGEYYDEYDNGLYQMIVKEKHVGWCRPQFISYPKMRFDIGRNCQYLKDDCLIFRVSVEMQ